MTNSRMLHLALAGIAAAAISAPILAQADIVSSRIAAYRELGSAFKNVNDELRSGSPTPITVRMASREIQKMATAQYGLFPKGSLTGKTKALPAIWADPAGFKNAQDKFAASAKGFAEAASSGDKARITAATRALGGTCKACHDSFRKND